MKGEHVDLSPGRLRRMGLVALYLWIGGTAIFFYLRFSLVFAHANGGAIRRFLDGLS